MQHIKRREKRAFIKFGDGDKYNSGFEGDPTDSDPGYEVTKNIGIYLHSSNQTAPNNFFLRTQNIFNPI